MHVYSVQQSMVDAKLVCSTAALDNGKECGAQSTRHPDARLYVAFMNWLDAVTAQWLS